jgi:type IV pilus assembly protein PilE
MRKPSGFTMVELMIVVAIIAILAAIAIPSYRRYVVRANRTEASKMLSDLAAREERFYYSNNVYTGTLGDLNGTTTMGAHNYAFDIVASLASVAPATYAITATATGVQAKDDVACQTIRLDNIGRWSSTGATRDDPKCWGER